MNRIIYTILLLSILNNQNAFAQSAQLSDKIEIKPVVNIAYGLFNSQKSYTDATESGQKNWHEFVAKYGIEAEYQRDAGTAYSSLIGVTSATFGDGDAAGITTGHERKTSLDQWNLGWRNGSADEATLDASIGRQKVQIADGFLVAGDALNFGEGYGDTLDRGGAYYLAARQSFDFTVVLNYQINEMIKTHWYYLKSDNQAQSRPALWSTDWQYQVAQTQLGLTYLHIIDVDGDAKNSRDHLKDIAVRTKIQVNEQVQLAAEYVYQDQKTQHENAWYAFAQYTFSHLRYQPTVAYRFSSFSAAYDPLFYGNTDAGFGTWFQGEVAANFAGPYSTNARIHQLSLQASVKEHLQLGILAYQFDTIDTATQNLDATEVDLFAVWSPTKKISIIPLVGFYKPKYDASNGGTQIGDHRLNTHAQLLLQYVY